MADDDSPQNTENRSFFVRNIPNAITFVTVFSGFLLMVSTSVPGVSPKVCVFATAMGLCADVLDGQAARVLRVKSKFGATFDQLADLTCFGIGPAIFFVRQQQQAMGADAPWSMQILTCLAGYMYLACSVFRIARELIVHSGDRPLYFVGIPTNLACVFAVPASATFAGSTFLPFLIVILSGMMVMPYHIPKGLW
eukprot:CAMPEP_0206445004 /NCGR_PEP_ID=MMETSP0324_2-20121206/15238_1 /ASSEMBLY_ACC=CAM_ASM_000836 /TAXON_ID=2866 /ORGANISM="Crypthecodinium cohnii, Strain Seligo" /LENGTH=194 /DNA_ID=CAMNT_0053913113 /DNA_START=87 /DNA_END=668 /DNA_ORIENTATION=-